MFSKGGAVSGAALFASGCSNLLHVENCSFLGNIAQQAVVQAIGCFAELANYAEANNPSPLFDPSNVTSSEAAFPVPCSAQNVATYASTDGVATSRSTYSPTTQSHDSGIARINRRRSHEQVNLQSNNPESHDSGIAVVGGVFLRSALDWQPCCLACRRAVQWVAFAST